MITVDLSNRKLAITFSHPTAKPKNPEHGPNGKERRKPGRFTRCEVFEILSGGQLKPLSSGQTACSRADHFRKETGRKLALRRALCNHVMDYKNRRCRNCGAKISGYAASGLTQKERTQVWRTYFDRCTQTVSPSVGEVVQGIASLHASQQEPPPIPAENQSGTAWAGMD